MTSAVVETVIRRSNLHAHRGIVRGRVVADFARAHRPHARVAGSDSKGTSMLK